MTDLERDDMLYRGMDRQALDAAYNNTAAVGEVRRDQYVAGWSARSDAFRRAWGGRIDLPYGDGARARLDFFACGRAAAPTLVYIHGGYWQELSKDQSAFLAPAWHCAGVAHAVVGYTLAPAARLPDIVSECRAALRWLQASANSLRFDAGNMVVAGSSAGGYLAAACADGLGRPLRGIVPVSGIYDVAPLIGTSINDALGLDASTASALDLLSTTRQFCPGVVAWGEIETSEFKRQSQAFAARLATEGLRSTCLEIPGRNHFDVIFELGNPESALFAAAHALFAHVTAPRI